MNFGWSHGETTAQVMLNNNGTVARHPSAQALDADDAKRAVEQALEVENRRIVAESHKTERLHTQVEVRPAPGYHPRPRGVISCE